MSPFGQKIIFKIFVPLMLMVMPFAIPLYTVNFDISTLITIFSLVFAILVGFFIATATTNYLNYQTYLAAEHSSLIVLYNLGKLVQPKSAKKLQNTIDKYVIATLDYSLLEYANKTAKELQAIVDIIDSFEPQDNDKRRFAALSYLHEAKANLINTLQSILFTAPRVVYAIHWFILIILTLILFFLLSSLRTSEILSMTVTGFMDVSLYLILLLLYELDNNQFLEDQLAYEDAQIIFRAIGKTPYYPEIAFKQHRAKIPDENYRIGIYKDFPASVEKKIKLCTKKCTS